MYPTMNEQPSKQYPNYEQNLKSMIFGGAIMDKGNVQIVPSVINWHQSVSVKNVKVTYFYTSLYLNAYVSHCLLDLNRMKLTYYIEHEETANRVRCH